MEQKGSHTWKLYLRYHRCPKCGFIIESRDDFENRFGKYVKELSCSRCHQRFTISKDSKPTFGPFTGDPQPAEFDWETNRHV